ncbi:MAG: hypothetical protein MUO63_09545 [Desulfobulbaceae bacterium]|nr:hypothetical protein [Desulfobulbaceae bacterium]
MKCIYFVTEGPTDQIVIEGLIDHWLGGEDFIPRYIQPPSSAYADGLNTNLSDGWKGVRDWCAGKRTVGPAGRDEALKQADCLIIHIDADVATDPDFKTPTFNGPCPPAKNACDWIRNHLTSLLGGTLPSNVVLCVPSYDLETWVLCALHPDVVDENLPIECRENPGMLLVQRPPHRLVRRKDGRLRKVTAKYKNSLSAIVMGWLNCTTGVSPRCPEAIRFEGDIKHTLGIKSG